MKRLNIAIIGSGISGLGSAYLLDTLHNITLYEKNNYLGGHSRTKDIVVDNAPVSVDTGFIVYNHKNYPNLTRLFTELNIDTTPSSMSFGVSINDGYLEYGTHNLKSMLADKRNIIRPKFWRMVRDIMKFNKYALSYRDTNLTMGECIAELGLSQWFTEYYILAMGGSIWSTPTSKMLDFPARTFITFFENHGLLTVDDQPQWYTVTGGSKHYVQRIADSLSGEILLHTPVERVERTGDEVRITALGETRTYDKVIFACHSNEVLELLDAPSLPEQELIGAVAYQPNTVILHTDTSYMQHSKGTWSSWVYKYTEGESNDGEVSLTYWMNNLQPLPTKTPILVTLNPTKRPKKECIYDETMLYHPVFNEAAISAQERMQTLQGVNNTYFTGAWQRYGFHEDGLSSAVVVANMLGASWK